MPIVKKDRAEFDSESLVSLAEYTRGGFGPAGAEVADTAAAAGESATEPDKADGRSASSAQDPEIELIRNGAGDIIRIDVRCPCGHTASLHCEYESPAA